MRHVGVLLATLLLCSGARAETPAPSPDAVQLLREMASAYGKLSRFHLKALQTTNVKIGEQTERTETPLVLAADGSAKARAETVNTFGRFVVVGNLESAWIFLPEENVYMREDLSDTAEDAPAMKIRPRRFVDAALDQFRAVGEDTPSARYLRAETLKLGEVPHSVHVIEADYRPEGAPEVVDISPTTLWIDAKTHLVLKQQVHIVIPDEESKVEVQETLAVVAASIGEELPDELFAFEPPEDAERVEDLGGPEMEEVNLTGSPAPDFSAKDFAGKSVQLSSLAGKVVLIDFWATWCGPCRMELPHVQKLHAELADKGLVVLGVNDEPADVAQKFMTESGYTFTSLVDVESAVARQYGVTGIPTVVIVGRDGVVSAHFVGAREEAELRAALVVAGIE